MVVFRILLAIDVLAAAVAAWLFVLGLLDGSVSDFNLHIWALLLGVLGAVPWGGWALRGRGHAAMANLLLLLVAVPAAAAGVMILAMIVAQPNWR